MKKVEITAVSFLKEDFCGERTAYSSPSIFVAILTNPGVAYDHEAIGSKIFTEGFGCINPPGPSFGFGVIVLNENEEDGLVAIDSLKNRSDDDGNPVSPESLKESLEEYFDGFFVVDTAAQSIRQIPFGQFHDFIETESEYKLLHFCEFEPDEDCDDED